MLACTEHGLYAYDGQRFFNLGPDQGLPEGGVVYDLAFTSSGNIVLRYSKQVFVSEHPLSLSHPPEALTFRLAISRAGPIFNTLDKQLTSWSGGAALIDHGRLLYVDPGSETRPPTLTRLDASLHQPRLFGRIASTLSGQGDTLWVGLLDGRICSISSASERCYGPRDGLPVAAWTAFLPDKDGRMLAQSLFTLASIDPRTGTVLTERLPYRRDSYAIYYRILVLARTPSGELLTQSGDGLMIREKSGWKDLSPSNGLPHGQITSVMFDGENNLWLAAAGKGVMKAVGYGLWENWNRQDGLSSDDVWQITREAAGPLWIATDRGLDSIADAEGEPAIRRHYKTPSFAISLGSFDHIWRALEPSGVSCIATGSGADRRFALPPVNQILRGRGQRIWFSTEDGIYFLDDVSSEPKTPQRLAGLSGSFAGAAAATDGSLWIVQEGTLVHRHADGRIVVVREPWKQPVFQPLAIALGQPGVVWVGGAGGGLYRIQVVGDRVVASANFNPPFILSNTVVSVLVDHRGWVWASTDNGISVFNGKRWVSADSGNGLIANDTSQDSLFEDVDGSVWIGTSQGLSHLLDPQQLFRPDVLQPVIISASLGDTRLPGRAIPYSREPLSLRFGALNVRSAVRFRYRLDGVDRTWADTAMGSARYPFLTPGHHRFTVVAYDPLTHQSSAPVSVLLRMQQPWWLWWPLEVSYALTAMAVTYGIWRIRFSYLLRQRRILHREVELRTRDMRAAQEALILLATQDSLTKLLTRGEIQKRLVDALADENQAAELTIGLLDIDHFKRINDRYGHIAGDDVLKEMGLRLKNALLPGEYGGRYGGEELLVVLTDAQAPGVNRVHDLKLATCGEAFLIENESLYVTCSIGVAKTCTGDTWKSLIGRADRALYQAKTQGRDRVIEAAGAAAGD